MATSDWSQLTWRQKMTTRFPSLTEEELVHLESLREDFKAQRDALVGYRKLEIDRDQYGLGAVVTPELEKLRPLITAVYEWCWEEGIWGSEGPGPPVTGAPG